MAGTPLLVVTDVGLAAASVATPTGPYIHITKFAVGSAYGYTPQRTDTSLNGSLLYEGVPIAWSYIGDNTLNIVCRIPPDSGPYNFGEVAIYQEGNVMFAKAAFDTLQTKYSSLGTNLLSTYTFNVLLKLEQSEAIFKIDTDTGIPPSVLTIEKWSDLYPPGVSANPDVPSYVVTELDTFGNSSFVHRASDEKWTLGTNYNVYARVPVTNGSTTWVEASATALNTTEDLTALANRDFVIEFADGYFRSVSTISFTAGTNTYRFNLNPDPLLTLPTVGSTMTLYRNSISNNFANLVNVPLMSYTVQGIARANGGILVNAPGIIQVKGLVHGGMTGGGTRLGTMQNLNTSPGGGYAYWPSGIYTIDAAGGYPANYPPVGAIPGFLHITNTLDSPEGGNVMQMWYPNGPAGVAESAYYRSLLNANTGEWGVWRKIRIAGSSGGGDKVWYNVTGSRPNSSYVVNDSDDELFVSVAVDSSSGGQITGAAYVDGVQVQSYNYRNNRYNNADSWGYPVGPGSSYMNVLNGDNRVIVVWSEYRSSPP